MPETLEAPPTTSPNATPIQAAPAVEAPKTDVANDKPNEGATAVETAKTPDPMQDVWAKPAKPAKKEAAPAKDAKTETADKGGEKKADAPADKPGDKKVVAAAKKDPLDNQTIQSIRNAEKAAKAEAAEWRGKYEQLQKNGGGDTAALTTSLTEANKKITQLETEIGTLNYRKNPDFVKNFDTPFKSAQKSAQNIVESLNVISGQDAEGNKQTRRASWSKDFLPMTAIDTEKSFAENRAIARDRARAAFGEDAPEAMAQWDKLFEAKSRRDEALREYSEKHGEIEAQARSKQIQESDNFKKAFDVGYKDLLEQNQELYGERPDDPEGNDLLKKMDAIIDPVFHAPETLAREEFVARLASIKHRVRISARMQRDLAVARDEITELKARISGSEESVNGETRKAGQDITAKPQDDDMRAAWQQ